MGHQIQDVWPSIRVSHAGYVTGLRSFVMMLAAISGVPVACRLCSSLFVPKPNRSADCQHYVMPDPAATVRRCPLTSIAGGGDCYSFGYSVSHDSSVPHPQRL